MGFCDFCQAATGEGKRAYAPKHSLALIAPGARWDDHGPWVACADCVALIEAQDWRGLMRHARERKFGMVDRELPAGLAQFIAQVWGAVLGQSMEVFF